MATVALVHSVVSGSVTSFLSFDTFFFFWCKLLLPHYFLVFIYLLVKSNDGGFGSNHKTGAEAGKDCS